MQDSQEQINTHVKELYNNYNELHSQISSERKFHAELTANYLEKIKSHESMINALENRLVYYAQEVSLKDSNIASYKAKLKDQQESAGLLIFSLRARVNELQNELKCQKLKHSSQGSNRTELSDKIQKNYDTSPLRILLSITGRMMRYWSDIINPISV
jgi:hypothetical protein